MVDTFVLLTPLVVLVVLLLLGFAGCDVVFGLDPPPGTIKLEVRLPSTLVVEGARFRYTPPGMIGDVNVTTLERADDVGTTVLSHIVTNRADGSWTVVCRVDVSDASGAATDSGPGDFVVDDSTPFHAVARFETTGSPATNDFRVRFAGVVAGE